MSGYISHIATSGDWQRGLEAGSYTPSAFAQDGFIHCSTADQVVEVANAYFDGQSGLVLLRIDAGRLKPELRFDDVDGRGTLFPHICGPLNPDAVSEVLGFTPGPDGRFTLPSNIPSDSPSPLTERGPGGDV